MARPEKYQDDIERIMDNYIDQAAITEDEIRNEIRDLTHPETGAQMFKGEGLSTFAEGITNATSPIREAGAESLSTSISPNPANRETLQVRDEKGRLGVSLTDSDGNLMAYDYDVRADGGLYAVRPAQTAPNGTDYGRGETRIDTLDLSDRGSVSGR